MPGILLPASTGAMKRPSDAMETYSDRPSKRSRRDHTVKFRQHAATECLSGAQDESFFQSQLLRAITLSLSAQGFESVEPLALESFRAAAEGCEASLIPGSECGS